MERDYYNSFYYIMFEYFVTTVLSTKKPALRFYKFFKFKGVHASKVA